MKKVLFVVLVWFQTTCVSSQHNENISRVNISFSVGEPILPKQLDESLRQSGAANLIEFLESREKHGNYMQQLMALHGEKMREENFDWVRKDVLRLANMEGSERFVERAWERSFFGKPITLRGTLRNPKAIDPQISLQSLVATLQNTTAQQARGVDKSLAQESCIKTVAELNKINNTPEIDEKQRNKERGRFFGQIKKSPEVQKSLAWITNQALQHLSWQGLATASPEGRVSAAVFSKALLQAATAAEYEINCSFPGLHDLVIKKFFPKTLQELHTRSQESFDQVYEFVPTTRALHTFWKGTNCDDCVGGQWEDRLTSERWATGALEGTLFFEVYFSSKQVPKKHIGFVQLVPLVNEKDQKTYASLDATGPELTSNRTFLFSSGKAVKTSAIEAFLLAFEEQMPRRWAGIVKSNSRATISGGVSPLLVRSELFQRATIVGSRDDLKHAGAELADFLIAGGRSSEAGDVYAGNMMTDGTSRGPIDGSNVSEIRLLAPGALRQFPIMIFATMSELQKTLEQRPQDP